MRFLWDIIPFDPADVLVADFVKRRYVDRNRQASSGESNCEDKFDVHFWELSELLNYENFLYGGRFAIKCGFAKLTQGLLLTFIWMH